MKIRPDRRAGFTLVELLVALVLFAMLSAALFAALRIAARGLDRVVYKTNVISGLAAADAVLQKTLRAIYPEYIPGPSNDMPGTVVFDGSARLIVFLTPAPLSLAPGGMALMKISVAGNGTIKDLAISAQPELAGPQQKKVLNEVLAANIAGASFSYWGADAPNTAAYWHGTWQNRQSLPRLIRISVIFQPGDSRTWPDLIVAPQIRVDAGCQFIPLTQSCIER